MNKRKERRSSAYKAAHRAQCASHYENNKKYYLDRNARLRQEKRRWLVAYKESRGCMDCHRNYPACVLDLDHRNPKEKSSEVTFLVNRGWAALKAEVEKCDVVCANCHRIRHHWKIG